MLYINLNYLNLKILIMKFFETLGAIMFVPLLIFIGMLITLLKTYIVLDISELFNVTFITAISFKTLFGILFIINFIWASLSYNLKEKLTFDDSDNTQTSTKIFKGIGMIIGSTIGLLITWGVAYVANGIFF